MTQILTLNVHLVDAQDTFDSRWDYQRLHNYTQISVQFFIEIRPDVHETHMFARLIVQTEEEYLSQILSQILRWE